MTALAMIIGMAPMALGLGEGGEQNAPLGRAVIGGLIFATFATLMFVPVVFSMVHKKQGAKAAAPSETSHVPTEPRPPVSRRKLGIFGVVALIAAGLVVVTGIRAREEQGSKLKEWTDDQAVPTRRGDPARRPRRSIPPSTCRAGSRPITARRSSPASPAT